MLDGLSKTRRWMVYFLFFLCYSYFLQVYPRWVSPGEMTRFLLISAVVDDGTLQLDQAIQRFGDTADKAIYLGHSYSEKAIGVSLLGIPFYAVEKWICALFDIHPPVQFSISWLRFWCVTIPTLLCLPALASFWRRIHSDQILIACFIFLFAFGSIAFTYALELLSHQLLGVVLFLSFYVIYLCKTEAPTAYRLLLAGLFAGFALTLEFPAVFPVLMILGYAFWILPEKRRIVWMLPGMAFFSVLILAYNYAIFGNPFELAYLHKATADQMYTVSQGFVGIRAPTLDGFYGLLFGKQHGMFYLSPFLLFALPGFFFFFRDRSWFREACVFAAVTLSYVFLYSGFESWYAGWNLGPRYLTPIVPFLSTAAFFFFSRKRILESRWIAFLGIVAGLWSFTQILVGTMTFPFHPLEVKEPFFHFYAPLFLNGGFGLNLGSWLNLPSFGTAVLFFTMLFITFLSTSVPNTQLEVPRSKIWFGAFAVIMLALFLSVGYFGAAPRTAVDHFALGRAYYFLGRDEMAHSQYVIALKSNPNPQLRSVIQWYMKQLYSTRVRIL